MANASPKLMRGWKEPVFGLRTPFKDILKGDEGFFTQTLKIEKHRVDRTFKRWHFLAAAAYQYRKICRNFVLVMTKRPVHRWEEAGLRQEESRRTFFTG